MPDANPKKRNSGGGNPKRKTELDDNKKSKASKVDTKMVKEVQSSDRVLLEVTQVLENLRSNDGILLLKTKQLTVLQDRVKARLTPQLVAVYSSGYEAGKEITEDMKGMLVLERLRDAQRALEGVVDLVQALNDAEVSGAQLHQAAKHAAATTKGVDGAFVVPSKLPEMALQRDADRFAKSQNFKGLMKLLTSTGEEGAFDAGVIEDAATRVAFQERLTTRLCADLLRQEDKLSELASLVDTVLGAGLLSDDCDIVKEMRLLLPLLQPLKPTTAVVDLETSLARFRADKGLKLHKMVCNFPSGLQLLDRSAKALEARAKDGALESRLCALSEKAEGLEVSAHDMISDFKAVNAELADIKANGSDLLKEQHEGTIQKVDKKLQAQWFQRVESKIQVQGPNASSQRSEWFVCCFLFVTYL